MNNNKHLPPFYFQPATESFLDNTSFGVKSREGLEMEFIFVRM